MTQRRAAPNAWFRLLTALFVGLVAWCWLNSSNGVESVEYGLVFRTNTDANVYLDTFLPSSPQTQLNFGGGAPSSIDPGLFAGTRPVLTGVSGENTRLALYRISPSHPACAQLEGLCTPGVRGLYVLVASTPEGSTASSSYAVIDGWLTRLETLHAFEMTPGQPQRLFVAAWATDNGPGVLMALSRIANDEFGVDLSSVLAPSARFGPYLLGAVALAVLLAWYAPSIAGFWLACVRESPFSTTVLTAWVLIDSIAVFPGIFTSDTQFGAVNGREGFSNWYSTLYFVYTGLFRVIGYEYIQLPLTAFGYFALLYTLRTIAAAFESRLTSTLVKFVFVAAVLLSPALFAVLFVQQRYFLAATLALLGATSAIYNYVKDLRSGESSVGRYTLAFVALACAGLLRFEYLVFAGFLLAALALRSLLKRNVLALALVAVAGLLLLAGRDVTERVIPQAYDHNTQLWNALYGTVTALSAARPYATCDGVVSSDYERAVARVGDLAAYCRMSPEEFFFSQVRPQLRDLNPDDLRALIEEARKVVLQDPGPFLDDRLQYAKRMFEMQYWHLVSRYERRDGLLRHGGAPSYHEAHADRFGVVQDVAAGEALNRAIVPFYAELSRIPPSYTMLALAVLIVVDVISFLLGAYMTGLFTGLALALLAPILAFAPAPNWAYLVFIPLWAGFVLPACVSEIAARRTARETSRPGKFDPEKSEQLARGIAFVALSGAGWLADMAIFSFLVAVVGLAAGFANFVSASIAAVTVFVTARRMIFGDRSRRRVNVVVFLVYTWIMILVWSLAIAWLSGMLTNPGEANRTLIDDGSTGALISKLIVTPLSLALNYVVARWLSMEGKGAPGQAAERGPGKILLFIPAYRCEAQISRVLSKLQYTAGDLVAEILVVDNRSPDGTVDAARRTAREKPHLPIRVVRNRENYGLGGSHKAAFGYAIQNRFDYVVTLHGDDQGDFGDLAQLIRDGVHHSADALLGARFMPGSRLQNYSVVRTLGNYALNVAFSLSAGRAIFDLGSGLNLYAVEKLKTQSYLRFADDLTFNYYMILAQRRQNLIFFPLEWREHDQISNVKAFTQTGQLLRILWGFIVKRDRFLEQEHREGGHQSYEFDDVTSQEAPMVAAVGSAS